MYIIMTKLYEHDGNNYIKTMIIKTQFEKKALNNMVKEIIAPCGIAQLNGHFSHGTWQSSIS